MAWTVTSTQDSVREIGHLTHGIARNRTPVREIGHLTHGQRHNECPVRGKRHSRTGHSVKIFRNPAAGQLYLDAPVVGVSGSPEHVPPGVHQPTLDLDAPVVGVRKDAVLDAADVFVEGAAGLAALGAGRHQIGAGNLGGLKHRLVGD